MSQIIIFGIKDKKRVVENGVQMVQNCPQCGPNRMFQEMEVRPHFSLFFIPVFPIGKGQTFITCSNCKTSFHFDAAAYHRAQAQAKQPAPAQPANLSPQTGETIVIHCVHCGERIGVPYSQQATSTTCPHCSKSFELKL